MPSPIIKKMDSTTKRIQELLPSAKGGFLTNKWMLYLVLFTALFDIFQFYQRGDVQSVMVFFIVGILISFFSKNMVVILILAIVITHLIRYGKNLTEGFEDDEDKDSEEFANEMEEPEQPAKTTEPAETEDAESFVDNPFGAAIASTDGTVKDKFSALESSDITAQTQQLLNTQKTLMANMKTLEPLLKDAESFLSRRNGKEKFTSLAEAYTTRTTMPTK